MTTTWIVAGDSSRARILQVSGRDRLEEIQDFVNPKGRLHERGLLADRRYCAPAPAMKSARTSMSFSDSA